MKIAVFLFIHDRAIRTTDSSITPRPTRIVSTNPRVNLRSDQDRFGVGRVIEINAYLYDRVENFVHRTRKAEVIEIVIADLDHLRIKLCQLRRLLPDCNRAVAFQDLGEFVSLE